MSLSQKTITAAIRQAVMENAPFKGLTKSVLRLLGIKYYGYHRLFPSLDSETEGPLRRARKTGGDIFAIRCAEEIQSLHDLRALRYDISAYIDVGANVGQNTLSSRIFFDDSVPIYAFEPASRSFDHLVANVAGYSNVHCYRYGVGQDNQHKEFYRSLSSPTSQASTFLRFTELYQREFPGAIDTVSEMVEMVSLDSFFSGNGPELSDNAMMHIDV